jgi:hypothetical protein
MDNGVARRCFNFCIDFSVALDMEKLYLNQLHFSERNIHESNYTPEHMKICYTGSAE